MSDGCWPGELCFTFTCKPQVPRNVLQLLNLREKNVSLPHRFLPLAFALIVFPAAADEGVWPFNQFPKDAVREKHKFEVTSDFLDRLRLASVRVAGGSGSFVSSNGLLLTSRQAVADCLTQLKHDSRNET